MSPDTTNTTEYRAEIRYHGTIIRELDDNEHREVCIQREQIKTEYNIISIIDEIVADVSDVNVRISMYNVSDNEETYQVEMSMLVVLAHDIKATNSRQAAARCLDQNESVLTHIDNELGDALRTPSTEVSIDNPEQ